MNNELKTSIKLDSSQAEKAIDSLCKKLDALTKSADRIANAFDKQEQAAQRANEVAVKVTTNLHKATVQTDILSNAFTKSADAVSKVAMRTSELSNKFTLLRSPLNNVQTKLDIVATSIRNARTATLKWLDSHQRIKSIVSRLTTMYNSTSGKVANISNKVRTWFSNQKMVQSATSATNSLLDGTLSRIRAIAATYLGIMGTKAVINLSDTMTSSVNKLNYTNANALGDSGYNADGSYSAKTLQMTQETMDKMYASSQKVRMSYSDMMSTVSKTMALAGDAFHNNVDNAIRFQEIMAEAYAVGGASAQEMSSSMYQLTQALGAGVLAGDELRSVREGAPLAYHAIEEFAQGVYGCTDSLKDMASQGKISSEMVVAAIMTAGNDMDRAFAQTAQTFDQTWTQIQNAAKYAFTPVSEMLRTMLNNAVDNGLIQKVEQFMVVISKTVQIVVTVIGKALDWIFQRWEWIHTALIAGLSTLLIFLTYGLVMAVLNHAAILGIATAIFVVIYAFVLWQQGMIDTCQVVMMVLGVIAAGLVVIALLIHSTALLIIAGVVLVAMAIFYYLEQVCGFVSAAGAVIANICLGVMEGIVQAVLSIVDPIIGIIEWFVNAWNGAFTSVGSAFGNFLLQLLSGLIGLAKPFAKLLDKAFGWDTNSMIESAQAAMKGWGKTEAAVTYSATVPDIPRFDVGEAYDKGYNFGAGVKSNINEWGAGVAGKLNAKVGSITNLDKLGAKLGLDLTGQNGAFPNAGDPAYTTGGGYNPSDALKDIAGNTSAIADSMDLTKEDLEYLRRAADMEWKKEYTTANITVDMSNYNTITKEVDADGFFTKLKDVLQEEMDLVANGVYV